MPLKVLINYPRGSKYKARSNEAKTEPWGTPQERDAVDEA